MGAGGGVGGDEEVAVYLAPGGKVVGEAEAVECEGLAVVAGEEGDDVEVVHGSRFKVNCDDVAQTRLKGKGSRSKYFSQMSTMCSHNACGYAERNALS